MLLFPTFAQPQASTENLWIMKVLYANNQLLTKTHVELEDNSINEDFSNSCYYVSYRKVYVKA